MVAERLRGLARSAIFHVGRYIITRPRLNTFAKRSLARFPSLDGRVRAIVWTEGARHFQLPRADAAPLDLANLTPRVHRVYLDLVTEIKNAQ
jgi:hypothetical protein